MPNSVETSPVWLITGTSTGLGRALVHAVLESGQRVIATSRDPSKQVELRQKYDEKRLVLARLDIAIAEQIEDVFKLAMSHFGRLDVVVNNAGYGLLGEIEATTEEEARKLFEVNFWGPTRVSTQAVKCFREHNPQGKGRRIINISTMVGYTGVSALGFYGASKYAIEGLTEALDRELPKEWDIRAIIIEPGAFDSEWVKGSMTRVPQPEEYKNSTTSASIIRHVLADRPPGAPSPDLGDINKMAKAIVRVAAEPNPPGRLQLGSDSWKLITEQNLYTRRESDEWRELACSTDKDGLVDGLQRGDALAGAMGILKK